MEDLYTTHAGDFSKTRQSPWKGWDRVLERLEVQELEVLDLGCGNARFLKYLYSKYPKRLKSYTGIDSSAGLLGIAKRDNPLPEARFIKEDLENPNWLNTLEGENFNFIVSFGLSHHLHSYGVRSLLYKNSYDLLTAGGYFCITFWQFSSRESLMKKAIKLEGIDNYQLSFGSTGAKRFAHLTTETEIEKIEKENNFTLVESFFSDGKEGDLNLYRIYKKDE